MSKLPPIDRVDFYRHNLGSAEAQAVRRVLRGVFLTAGPETAAFENEAARFLDVSQAVGVMSCTSALQLTLLAMGLGPGDEVVTTPMSYVATANAILQVGATPVFVDVEPHTGNMDISLLEAAITPRTRAIIPVHLYGHMVDMMALLAVARKHGLAVVEDAAHCFEGLRSGHRPGQLSTAACFSFYATKNLTSGEGGMVATNDAQLAQRLRRLRNHGVDRPVADRHMTRYQHWDQIELGYKANMNDLQAALLRPQLPRLHQQRERRERLVANYVDMLGKLDEVTLMQVTPETLSAHHLFTVLVPPQKRDAVLAGLQARGVGVAVNYRPIHLMTYYRERFGYQPGSFPIAEHIGASTISLPLYHTLTSRQQKYVVAALKGALEDA